MRLLDLRCDSCKEEWDDIWWDEVFKRCPVCQNGTVSVVMKRAPIVDAKMPFYVESLGKTFTSTMQMDRYAAAHGKVVEQVDGRKMQSRPTKSVEERLKEGQKKAGLTEIVKKSAYRLRHGYKDTPPLPKESELMKGTV
jgi:hypothetical protein